MSYKQSLRVLTVDDHEMITIGYKYTLEAAEFDDYEVRVEIANTFEKGQEKIENSVTGLRYDLIMLDINLSQALDAPLKSGEQLGILARKLVPASRVVFMSSFSDSYRINNLMTKVDPDGYLVKSEIDELTLTAMIKTIIGTETPYYTASALSAIRRKMANQSKIDDVDKAILYRLSIGERTKDIEAHVSLSLTTIEKRKRHLKAMFGVEKENDMALIVEARNRGFI